MSKNKVQGVQALAGFGLEGAAVINEEEKKPKQSTVVTVSATNPAQENASEINLRQSNFLQQAGLQPSDYLGRFKENSWQFCSTLVVFQIIFIILFAIFVDYDSHIYKDSKYISKLTADPASQEYKDAIQFFKDADHHLVRDYAWFQDVHVMIIVGFGFLMTFLKRYSWSSLGFNFLFSAFAIQWGMLVQGWFFETSKHQVNIAASHWENLKSIHINIHAMMEAEFSAGVCLISFGAVLGVASPVQLLIMILFEMVFYKLNAWILLDIYNVADIGGSMVIHAFGAYFGLAVARCLFKKGHIDNPAEGGEYHSDIFSLVGTVFLWMFWPSFNSMPGGDDDPGRYLAVMNTYLALAGACMMTYATSIWCTPNRRITMEHVQNATLAGGVAMGSAASMPVTPFGAIIIGAIAGILSTCGYSFIKPALANAINLHDTCGVHNLHGMPAVMGAIASVIRCAAGYYTSDHASGTEMANFQLAGLATTLGISLVGGTITGFMMNIPLWEQLELEEYFEDGKYWEMEVYQVPQEE
ncbi:Oidioi.mRNA.OKI2018_I69.XSR.g15111.t1.cds [Oikopleura dioica]|uniref:Oidioi.mRNA.OKI2018_I69.XSR.g15111.t1.cds n=1 Tax=Oikopleura dioica TaxID=34765 RepID=A0ABN7SBT8_OIKDI|nr:Oidioi.mRNA.OKI2018_I69.XSR.g15111.t1.cds [Oikopleura dioica]